MEFIPIEWSSLPEIGERTVRVFALCAEPNSALVERAHGLLNATEQERAARYRVAGPRAEFVVGRALLRTVLAHGLGCSPEVLPLSVDEHGKPGVRGVFSSVSHSRGVVYVAACRAGAVGVDVEWIDPALEALELAEANFTLEESAYVRAAKTGEERAHIFCRLWTRKEALAKAFGHGLRLPLQDLRVPFEEEGPAHVLREKAEGQERHTFHVHTLQAPRGYAAALVTAAANCDVTFFPEPRLRTS